MHFWLQGTLEVSPVTGRLEPTYPAWKRNVFRYLVSVPIIILCLLLVFIVMIFTLQLQVCAAVPCCYHTWWDLRLSQWWGLWDVVFCSQIDSISEELSTMMMSVSQHLYLYTTLYLWHWYLHPMLHGITSWKTSLLNSELCCFNIFLNILLTGMVGPANYRAGIPLLS